LIFNCTKQNVYLKFLYLKIIFFCGFKYIIYLVELYFQVKLTNYKKVFLISFSLYTLQKYIMFDTLKNIRRSNMNINIKQLNNENIEDIIPLRISLQKVDF